MKILCVPVILAVLLGACAPGGPVGRPTPDAKSALAGVIPSPSPTAPVQASAVRASPVYTVTEAAGYVDTYLVDPGLDDPTPPLGGRVNVRAKLIKNGLRLWFAPTQVTWMQGGEPQLCEFLPLYLAGCIIEVRAFVPGVYVPVTVTMRYQGMVFTGYAGFTPR
jgi:hypothetical protein